MNVSSYFLKITFCQFQDDANLVVNLNDSKHTCKVGVPKIPKMWLVELKGKELKQIVCMADGGTLRFII